MKYGKKVLVGMSANPQHCKPQALYPFPAENNPGFASVQYIHSLLADLKIQCPTVSSLKIFENFTSLT